MVGPLIYSFSPKWYPFHIPKNCTPFLYSRISQNNRTLVVLVQLLKGYKLLSVLHCHLCQNFTSFRSCHLFHFAGDFVTLSYTKMSTSSGKCSIKLHYTPVKHARFKGFSWKTNLFLKTKFVFTAECLIPQN